MSEDDRVDLVVYGATGFTGRQLLRYLHLEHARDGTTWAVAGRRRGALEQLAQGSPVLVAPLDDPAALCETAARGRVVLNLAGPYAPHAEGLISACIATGTHYADLSGEIAFTRALIERHHDAASGAGVTVIPQCGYESLPFDLLTTALHRAFARADGSRLLAVQLQAWFVYAIHPLRVGVGMSGGTVATTIGFARPLGIGQLVDPFALVDQPGDRDANAINLRARRDPTTGDWLCPLAPAPFVNPAVVHRTDALGAGYAPGFAYQEAFNASRTFNRPAGGARLIARGFADLTAAITALSEGRAGRADRLRLRAFARLGPRPGDGPREDRLDALGYRLHACAQSDSGRTATATLDADGNAGYRSSPHLLAEAGLRLARGEARIAGVVTPAAALGPDLLDELEPAGLRYSLASPASNADERRG